MRVILRYLLLCLISTFGFIRAGGERSARQRWRGCHSRPGRPRRPRSHEEGEAAQRCCGCRLRKRCRKFEHSPSDRAVTGPWVRRKTRDGKVCSNERTNSLITNHLSVLRCGFARTQGRRAFHDLTNAYVHRAPLKLSAPWCYTEGAVLVVLGI